MATETKTSFREAHLENRLWANELEFYREEMSIYQSHLNEQRNRNTSMQQSEKVDHFENQFARLREMVNALEVDLHHAEKQMAMYAQQNETKDLDEIMIGDHQQFKQKVEAFKEAYLKLKQDYRNFDSNF